MIGRLIVLILICFSAGCVSHRTHLPMPAADGDPITYDPPEPERWNVDGIEVIYLENNELPFINATLYFRHGSLNVPDLDPAAVSVAGQQMRAGGAGRWSADELDEELEILSAGIASSLDEEYGSVSVSGLVSDKERLFELFSAVVQKPRFEEQRLKIWQGKALESIRRRKEDPYTVASISFNELLYPETPYGYVLEAKTVRAIKRVDLLRAHRALVRPERSLLAITGSVSRAEVTALVKKYFADWKANTRTFEPIPEVKTVPRPGIYLIEMPFEQSTFIMGHLGVTRLSPQHVPIIVFNEVFGAGGFTSRLVKRVRVDLGLAYSTYGAVLPGTSLGKNIITSQTKAASSAEALAASVRELRALQTQLISKDELAETHRAIENSFVFKFASPEALVNRVAVLDLLEYPEEYDREYLEKINAVAATDVQQVARTLWEPEQFIVVLVGNKTACDSLEHAMSQEDFPLYGLPVRRVQFDESLVLH